MRFIDALDSYLNTRMHRHIFSCACAKHVKGDQYAFSVIERLARFLSSAALIFLFAELAVLFSKPHPMHLLVLSSDLSIKLQMLQCCSMPCSPFRSHLALRMGNRLFPCSLSLTATLQSSEALLSACYEHFCRVGQCTDRTLRC